MKIKFFTKGTAIMLLAATLLSGCTKEDESDCVGNMNLTFRFTRNGQDNFGPQVPSLSVFVFDEAGIYLGRWDEWDNGKFSADYIMSLPLLPGKYSFVAWGGLKAPGYYLCSTGQTQSNATDPVIGRTHIDDMLLRLSGNHSNEVTFIPTTQFHGESLSQTVIAGQANEITINLTKNSKEIRVTVLGLSESLERMAVRDDEDPFSLINMRLTAPNGGYDFHNRIEYNSTIMTYVEQNRHIGTDNSLISSFHTLQLKLKDKNQNNIPYEFTIWNRQFGSAFHTADLLHDYINKVSAYDTQSEIDEEDFFDVVIDLGANLGVSVTVNGWKIDTSNNTLQ